MPEVEQVSPAAALDLVNAGALLLDVREAEEWVLGHAPQATHLAMSEISGRAGEIPDDRAIVCVCRSGARSEAVAEALMRGGWEAVNLAGGMQAWAEAGLPIVDDAGVPGTVG